MQRYCFCSFVLRFCGTVNPLGSYRALSPYLTTLLLGRLSPLIVHILSSETDNCNYVIYVASLVDYVSVAITETSSCKDRLWSVLMFFFTFCKDIIGPSCELQHIIGPSCELQLKHLRISVRVRCKSHYSDGAITARYRFIKNAYWDVVTDILYPTFGIHVYCCCFFVLTMDSSKQTSISNMKAV